MHKIALFSLCFLSACASQQERTMSGPTSAGVMATPEASVDSCNETHPLGAPVGLAGLTYLCERDGRAPLFATGYSKTDNHPMWVTFFLNRDRHVAAREAKLGRRSSFTINPALDDGTYKPPVHDDYTNSHYDRGHLAPSATMQWSREAWRRSYFTSNIAPQVPDMNQRIWRCVEASVRDWADQYDLIYIVVGVLNLIADRKTIGQRVQIRVPSHYFVVVFREKPERSAIAIMIPNRAGETDIRRHWHTVADFERRTGINLHPTLSAGDAKVIEAAAPNSKDWPVRNPVLGPYQPDDYLACKAPTTPDPLVAEMISDR